MSSKIAVDYAVSYLAGEKEKRPSFLKNLVLRSVLTGDGIGSAISPAYRNGHYFKTRRYLKWVNKPQGYLHAVGLPPLQVLAPLSSSALTDIAAVVEPLVDNPDGHDFHMHGVQVRTATVHDYAERYIKENHPEWAGRNFVAESSNAAGDQIDVYIAAAGAPAPQLPAPTSGYEHLVSFTAPDYDESSPALVVQYTLQSQQPLPPDPAPFMPGTEYDNGYVDSPIVLPAEWQPHGSPWQESTSYQAYPYTYFELAFVENGTTYEDWVDWGDIGGAYVDVPILWQEYRKQPPQSYVFEGNYPNEIARLYEVRRIGVQKDANPNPPRVLVQQYPGTYNGAAGEFRRYETRYELMDFWWYETGGRIEEILVHADIQRTFIYTLGSGNAVLDGIITGYLDAASSAGVPSPPRPLVINHTRIDELGDRINVGHRKHWMDTPWPIIRAAANNYTGTNPNPAWKLVRMAARKQTGKTPTKILKEVTSHTDYKDFSYVYYFDGIPLNTKRKYLTRYVWEYFRGFAVGGSDVNAAIANILSYNQQVQDYYTWLDAVEAKAKGTATAAQLVLANGPAKILPAPPNKAVETEIRWGRDNDWASWIHYSLCMYGCFGSETTVPGQQINAYTNKPAKRGECWITNTQHATGKDDRLVKTLDADVTTFWYQEELATCRKYSIANLRFEKWVWRWGYVTVTAAEALQDPDESKFFCLVLQAPLKEIGIVKSIQILVESPILEIDVYVQKRKKFGFLQILGVIVSIVVSFISAPAGQAIGSTLLNIARNMIVAVLASKAAVKLFGNTFGPLVALFASMVFASPAAAAQSFRAALGNLFTTIEGLAQLTNAVSQSIQGYVLEKMRKMQGDFAAWQREYKQDRSALQQLMDEAGVSASTGINAHVVLDALKTMFNNESPDEFLTRTLMTGHELAEATMSQVSSFSSNQLVLR